MDQKFSALREVVTIAFGAAHRAMASKLIGSLRQHSPALRTRVITDSEWTHLESPDCVSVKAPPRLGASPYGWKAEYLYPESGGEENLYLDPDVIVTQDVTPLFDLLKYYDAGFRFFGPPLGYGDLKYHPKVHGGVILFRKNCAVEAMFCVHEQIFAAVLQERLAKGSNYVDDERTLSEALAKSKVRVVHLDNYAAFHTGEVCSFWTAPFIYHTNIRNISEIDERLRASWTDRDDLRCRVWLPRIKTFVCFNLPWRDDLLTAAYLYLFRLRERVKGAPTRAEKARN